MTTHQTASTWSSISAMVLTPHRPMVVLSSLRDDVDRLGDAGLAAGAEAIGIGAADHAGFGAERERAHHVLAGADAAVEHDFHLRADGVDDLRQHLDR